MQILRFLINLLYNLTKYSLPCLNSEYGKTQQYKFNKCEADLSLDLVHKNMRSQRELVVNDSPLYIGFRFHIILGFLIVL